MRSQAEANLDALFESTEDLIWSVGLDFRLVTFNRAFQVHVHESFGVDVAPGMRSEDWLPPTRKALWPGFYARALEQGPFLNEFRIADGRTLELTFHPIRVDGQATGVSVFGKDITRRKRAEKALDESGRLFRAITDTSPLVMVLLTGLEERIQYINPTFTQLFGYTLDDIPTASEWWPRAYPDPEYLQWVQSEWQRKVERTFATDSPFEPIEVLVTCKNGSVKLIRWGFLSFGDKNLAFGLDITEHKAAERQLRESEERYRATFEQAAVGIIHTALDGRILRCNERFAEIIGYPMEEVKGLSFQQITHPDSLAENEATREDLQHGNLDHAIFEKRYIRRDGSLTWVRLTTSPQRDSEGRTLHFIAVVEDINALKAAEEALQSSEVRYRTAFQTTFDSINIVRAEDGLYIDVNDACLRTYGYERSEVVGHTSAELNLWVDAQDRKRWMEILRKDSTCINLVVRLRRKDGKTLWALISSTLIKLDGVSCILTISRDITEEKEAAERLSEAQEALKKSESRYRTAFQTCPDAVNIARISDGMIIDANQAFLEITGFTYEEVIGRKTLDLQIWADPQDRESLMQALRASPHCRDLQFQFRRKNGELFWARTCVSRIELDGIPCLICYARDISETLAAREEIKNLAFYDPLTGLPNRRLLLDRLRRSLATSDPGSPKQALLLIDLDYFKVLNDTVGHQIGDLLLQEAARRLSGVLHETNTAARLGGDEFVAILEELSDVPEEAAGQAQDAAEKILEAFAEPYLLAGRHYRGTASIGITVFGANRKDAEDVLQQADIALGQAKSAGRNTMRFFAPSLQAAVNARVRMEEDLRQAIGTPQLLLYYQPQIEDGQLVGAEALIRWLHPRHGFMAPNSFIPLSEETGLILPLGDWILETACRQIAAWENHPQASGISVAVNISARQLHQQDFTQRVIAALERTGANPKRLKLELTESMLVENVEEVILKMTQLQLQGISFSLDDFGTGYSSLSYLKRLPLDQLKIDLSFVRDILMDTSSGAIAQTIISLGRTMGLSVIAEGVENEEQRALLESFGCRFFQGYLFSRPLPVDAFERLLTEDCFAGVVK
jgi:diguanylate cyclase (GGDEF)-like protein/PAS domain S-box-containing protein